MTNIIKLDRNFRQQLRIVSQTKEIIQHRICQFRSKHKVIVTHDMIELPYVFQLVSAVGRGVECRKFLISSVRLFPECIASAPITRTEKYSVFGIISKVQSWVTVEIVLVFYTIIIINMNVW